MVTSMDKDDEKKKGKKKKRRSRLCRCFGENERKSVISQSIALLNSNYSGFCRCKDGLFLPFYCSGEKKWTYSFLLLFFSIVFFFFSSWESVKTFICHRLIVEYIVYFNVSGSSFTLFYSIQSYSFYYFFNWYVFFLIAFIDIIFGFLLPFFIPLT